MIVSTLNPLANKTIAVFCGSNTGFQEVFLKKTKELAKYLVSQDMKVVYGGGKVGLMGILADEVMRLHGQCIGVIPEFLKAKEVAHDEITEMVITENMHERKLRIYALADAFIALPGGLGTLDELFEVSTWSQLGLHSKPILIYNIDKYYNHLIEQLQKMTDCGFLKLHNLELMQIVCTLEEVDEALKNYHYSAQPKWIKRG